jgi:LysM repeat protein
MLGCISAQRSLKKTANMKKLLLFIAIVFCTVFTGSSQEKKYLEHIVREGESLRKIARKYRIKKRALFKLNPDLRKKPVENTVLLVPNPKYKEVSREQTSSLRSHIVQPKETLFGIAKKYSVPLNLLKEYNPFLKDKGLDIGMVLKIPQFKVLSQDEQRLIKLANLAKMYELHTVVKDDSFYSLTRNYHVSKESLLRLNPDLKGGLKLGMVLKIWRKRNIDNTLQGRRILMKDSTVNSRSINVALLFPFKFRKNDTLTKEQLFSSKGKLENIVTDFYLGVEIAIDSLKKQGLSINLKVFDSENNKDCILDYFDAGAFDSIDVVFGPVYNKHVNMVAERLKDIPVVYPFYSKKQGAFTNQNVIKTAPDHSVYEKVVLDYFKRNHNNEHVVVVGNYTVASELKMRYFKRELLQKDSISEVAMLQPEEGFIQKERFEQAIDTLGVNWVLLTTNNKVVTADVVNNLKSLPNNASVRLFAMEKAKNFEIIDNNTLAKMNFTYAVSGVQNDSLPEVAEFYRKYLLKNYAYPTDYAIRGFDIVYDVLVRMSATDESLLDTDFSEGSRRVGNSFFYEKEFLKPISNKAVYLRKYNEDLTIEDIPLYEEESEEPREEDTRAVLSEE